MDQRRAITFSPFLLCQQSEYHLSKHIILYDLLQDHIPSSWPMYQFFPALCWCTYLPPTSTCSILRSDDVPTVPSSDFYLPSFAFCWYSYPILSSYCPLCILVIYLKYLPLTSTCSLLHSAYVPTVVSCFTSISLIILLKNNLLHSQLHLQVLVSTMMTYLHPCPFLLTSHSSGHPLPFLPNIF